MIIDVVVGAALLMAIIKGYQKGLIVALFSILAFVAGIAAALKLSTTVASWLDESTNIGVQWLPFISFLLVFLGVVLLVRMGASFLEKGVQLVFLGWLNKVLGIILFILLYMIILSVFLFYAYKMKLFSESAVQESVTFEYIYPWAPRVIETIGLLIPVFKNMFEELTNYFNSLKTTVVL
jgi:membrane protein required for colicin V production